MVIKNKSKMIACLIALTMILSAFSFPLSAIAMDQLGNGGVEGSVLGAVASDLSSEGSDASSGEDDESSGDTTPPAGDTYIPSEESPLPINEENVSTRLGGGVSSEIPSDLIGSGSYGGSGSSGTQQGDSGSVPRVIVTGFSTDPGEVMAGSNFNLVINLRNTSKTMKVKNMLFTLTTPEAGENAEAASPVFLPSSGSNSIYLESISADGYADISIYLNAKNDLLQKPYSMNLTMVYEDENANQFESVTSISIPVKQPVRFEIGELEINPQEIEVGSDSNIMCNIYNMGRVKLYNVKATFVSDTFESTEIFLGNIMPGATAPIDAMITATSPTSGPAIGKMIVSYEDEAGTISEKEKEFSITVMEPMNEDMIMEEVIMEGPSFLSFLIPVILALVIIAIIVIIVVTKKKKKKRMALDAEENLIDELD